MPSFRKSSGSDHEHFRGKHRFEHWYRDNQVYFITARVRSRFPAFSSESAKAIFWNRFDHYTRHYGFVPWVTSLMDNHYHTLGYMRVGDNLGVMMQRLHGSVAKLVNDELPNGSPLSGATTSTATTWTAASATSGSAAAHTATPSSKRSGTAS